MATHWDWDTLVDESQDVSTEGIDNDGRNRDQNAEWSVDLAGLLIIDDFRTGSERDSWRALGLIHYPQMEKRLLNPRRAR